MLNNIDKYLLSDAVDIIPQNTVIKVLSNYKTLIEDTSKIIDFLLKNNVSKPLAMHNVFFLIELGLKYYLIINSELKISEIENIGHNIVNLMKFCQQTSLEIDGLDFILRKFRDKNGRKLDFNIYHNFKYNREKGKDSLIFELEYSEKEKKNIKEVIKWINQHILHL